MQVPVLIVGGGPVGLVASVCLSRLGVGASWSSVIPAPPSIPRRATSTCAPWRSCGRGDRRRALRRSAAALVDRLLRLRDDARRPRARPHADRELRERARVGVDARDRRAVVAGRLRAGDPPARRAAGPGELRFDRELEEHDDQGDGVRSRVRRRDDGSALEIESRFLLGCDGWSSAVRRRLGIAMEGPSDIGHFVNVYFRADLARWTADRPAVLYFVASDDARGVFQPLDGRGRWLCQISSTGAPRLSPRTPEERCLDWIRRAVGSPEVAAEILSVGTWTMNATVATRVSFGPGPARRRRRAPASADRRLRHEHRRPGHPQPGVEDRGRARGWAGPAILDSYDAERRPVARTNADRSLENSRMVGRINRTAVEGGGDSRQAVAASRRYGNFTGMDLGFRYEHGALVPDGTRRPRPPTRDRLCAARRGRGTARRTCALQHQGREISTLDLFDGSFTLLARRQRTRLVRRRAAPPRDRCACRFTPYVVGRRRRPARSPTIVGPTSTESAAPAPCWSAPTATSAGAQQRRTEPRSRARRRPQADPRALASTAVVASPDSAASASDARRCS